MVQINNQYDTANAWFTICSVGAIFSLVFSIMGIKWWFRKSITFDHDPNVESIARPGRSNENNISVATTGIYRPSKDVDNFEVFERPKSLPPVKVRPSTGQPFLPTRYSFVEKSQSNERPIPEEIIPIPDNRIPRSPPSTPVTAVRDDLSKPVVIDINIPGENGCILQMENELEKPEIRQTLTLGNGESLSSMRNEREEEVLVPKPRARKRASVPPVEENEKQVLNESSHNFIKPIVSEVEQETVIQELNNHDHLGSSEIIASSDKLNEFQAFIDQEQHERETTKDTKVSNEVQPLQSSSLEFVEVIEPPVTTQEPVKMIEEFSVEDKFVENVKINPLMTNETRKETSYETQNEVINERKNEVPNEITNEPEIVNISPVPNNQPETEETLKNPQLNIDKPLDVSKIVSPKPRMRKGILKKRAPPVPVAPIPDSNKEEEEIKEEEAVLLRWVDDTKPENEVIENLDTNVKKEVTFDNKEPDIIERPESVVTIGNLIEYFNEQDANVIEENKEKVIETIEEPQKQHKTVIKLDEKLLEEHNVEMKEELSETNHTQVIANENFDEVTVKSPEKVVILDPNYVNVDQKTDTDTVHMLSEIRVFEKDVVVTVPEVVEEVTVKSENEIDQKEDAEVILKETQLEKENKIQEPEKVKDEVILKEKLGQECTETGTPLMVDEVKEKDVSMKNEQESVEKEEISLEIATKFTEKNEIISKKPVTIPRKIITPNDENLEISIKDKEVTQQQSTWEPQTIVHNDQVLVITPPPNYPPPMLPNSYLSDDSDESGTSEEYDENNPPKPPKRYRIYVVNSDAADNHTKVKPILKVRPPQKRVSFDNASPDIHLRTPDIPSSVDNTDTESLTSPLMPNMMVNDLSPKIRSKGFNLLGDETEKKEQNVEETIFKSNENEKELEREEKSIVRRESNEKSEENLIESDEKREDQTTGQVQEKIDVKLKDNQEKHVDSSQQPEPVKETPNLTPTANLLDLDVSPSQILNIQSPLEEKVEAFKLLAEKLENSPVKSPERQFNSLLTPEAVTNVNGNDQKIEGDKVQSKSFVSKAKSEETIPRPTSLLLADTKKSIKNDKKPRRQLSEPVISPRDALLAEIRSFGTTKKLSKRDYVRDADTKDSLVETPTRDTLKTDIEEALI